ncbi:MAG: glycosyltransferase family 2 protein [Pyrinomonadaceae bacterium]
MPEKSANITKKISIALCTFNGAKFLSEQLESFLSQTRLPDELVVCDDCSQDGTVNIIESFSRTAPFPVRLYVNEKNLRSTKNFEKAISLCIGDLIFLSDQDDVWAPRKLERIEAEFGRNPNFGMVFSNAELVDENLEPIGHDLWEFSFSREDRQKARTGKMLEIVLIKNVVTGATMAFRSDFREMLTRIPTDIPDTIHDAWIAVVIAANAEVAFLDEKLIRYRQHAGQQLGIEWKYTGKLKKGTRNEKYAESVGFRQNEQERLSKFNEIFRSFPQFQKHHIKIRIDSLIDSLKIENEEMIRHYEARKNLPPNRFQRIIPVFNEFRSGRYNRFSKGLMSVAKDLFENWQI